MKTWTKEELLDWIQSQRDHWKKKAEELPRREYQEAYEFWFDAYHTFKVRLPEE